jgi:hypothetical protein
LLANGKRGPSEEFIVISGRKEGVKAFLFLFRHFPVFSYQSPMSNVTSTFLDKLKEQSFTIILMIGGLYYQNQMFQQQLERYDANVKEKQEYIDKIVDAERERMIAREQYLMKQRDEFIQILKDKK